MENCPGLRFLGSYAGSETWNVSFDKFETNYIERFYCLDILLELKFTEQVIIFY